MNQYAPIKTVHIAEDVLDILKYMEWSQHNELTHGVITSQLERKLYVKTNKVLTALGGKWNRKAKAHIFDTDPRPALGIVIANEQMDIVKDGFYPTPRPVGIVMAKMADIQPGMDVLEPSAGTGALIEAIFEVQPRCRVFAIEINDGRREKLIRDGYNVVDRDFFHHTVLYDRVVQNPPFENFQDIAHALHAYDCLRPGGILISVIGEGAFFRNDRKALEFRAWLDGHDHETRVLEQDAFHESGTDARARIVKVRKVATRVCFERRETNE